MRGRDRGALLRSFLLKRALGLADHSAGPRGVLERAHVPSGPAAHLSATL